MCIRDRYCPAKRGKHHQLSNEKGGENVEPNRREFIKQCAFQKFCNTVLHNEACDAHKELHRHKAREITFSDLTLEEARQLHTFDEYFKGEIAFERAGKKITPKLLLEAIRTLPEEKDVYKRQTSNSVKYCPVCRKRITRRQAAERMRKRRTPRCV